MAIDSKDLLVWVKAMSRGQALPLDASEIYTSMADAETYASSAIAYAGQTIKVLQEDGKYHEYILQPSDSGYVLENAGVDVHDHNDIYYTETEIDSMIGAFVEEDYVIEQIETAIANQNLFSGDYNDLTNKPTIPTIPDTLPANGGNADTVDGKHAEDFALADHDHDDMYVSMQTFTDLVGDTKVEDQINDKLNDIQIEKEIYAQDDEPVDVDDGTVWIDMDAQQVNTSTTITLPTATASNNGKFMRVINGVWDVSDDVVLYTEQTLTEEQKAQARANIGAATVADVLAALPTWTGGAY